jgi:hypothetical protein
MLETLLTIVEWAVGLAAAGYVLVCIASVIYVAFYFGRGG